jgi:UDP-N-acetylglucosamine 2-epimerase (non-hydrolysing)
VILVVFGTTGELIKLAPVLLRLDERGHSYLLVTTGQQVEQIPAFLEQFGLRQPDLWLARGAKGRDLRVNADIPGWLATVIRSWLRERRRVRRALRQGLGRPLVLVHGDTMTTVLGSMFGRSLRTTVAHIEGGLRSYDLRHPFPEELNRNLATALSRIHYAPGAWAASNLRRGEIVDTGSNTIRDSLELVTDGDPPVPLPEQGFGIVSLHRFELLNNRTLLTDTIEGLAEAARGQPMLFVDHSVTAAALERFGLQRLFEDTGFRRIPRLRFFDFVRAERRSAFVVTDSGGSQEECYYLDLPCLVHRMKTERREGLGENALLSGLRIEVLRDFLDDPSRFRRRSALPTASPSDVIVDDLERRGFAADSKAGVGVFE